MKKTNATNLFAVLVAVFFTTLITACGGGSGESSGETIPVTPATPPTPVTPVPTATVSSLFPQTGATGISKTTNPVVVLAVTNATSGDASTVVWKCNNTNINFIATTAPLPEKQSLIVTFATKTATDLANIHGSDYCTISGDVSVMGAGGTVKMPVSLGFYIVTDVAVAQKNACKVLTVLNNSISECSRS